MATFICACFAKTSVIWIPLFYISTSTQFQFGFVNQVISEQIIGNKPVAVVAFGNALG